MDVKRFTVPNMSAYLKLDSIGIACSLPNATLVFAVFVMMNLLKNLSVFHSQ